MRLAVIIPAFPAVSHTYASVNSETQAGNNGSLQVRRTTTMSSTSRLWYYSGIPVCSQGPRSSVKRLRLHAGYKEGSQNARWRRSRGILRKDRSFKIDTVLVTQKCSVRRQARTSRTSDYYRHRKFQIRKRVNLSELTGMLTSRTKG